MKEIAFGFDRYTITIKVEEDSVTSMLQDIKTKTGIVSFKDKLVNLDRVNVIEIRDEVNI